MSLGRKEEETENLFLSEFTVFERRALRSKGMVFSMSPSVELLERGKGSITSKELNEEPNFDLGPESKGNFEFWKQKTKRSLSATNLTQNSSLSFPTKQIL